MNSFPRNKTSFSNESLTPEIVALLVFAGFYVFARLVELYLLPLIPEFVTREISALFKWGPILVPIVFGIAFYSNTKKKPKYDDDVLKERMMAWTKK